MAKEGITMNLNQVQYMLAIHETGSIRQAADNLFVSAPSISTAVKNLEEELGCSLLIRHHNGVVFTEEGEEAILLMKEMAGVIDKLHHLRQNINSAIKGDIRVGASLHSKAALLLPAQFSLKAAYPALSLIVTDEKSHNIPKQIIDGTFELGLIHYSNLDGAFFMDSIQRNNLVFAPLFEGDMRFVVREGHPLTDLPEVSMTDILQYPFLNYYKADFTKEHHKFFHHFNPNYKIIQTEDRDMYRNLLHNSDAVTTMPALNAQRSIKQFTGLIFLHVPNIDYRCTIGWLHNNMPLTPAEKAVISALEKEVAHSRGKILE